MKCESGLTGRAAPSNLVDVYIARKKYRKLQVFAIAPIRLIGVKLALAGCAMAWGQIPVAGQVAGSVTGPVAGPVTGPAASPVPGAPAGPPPSSVGVFPLAGVHRGLTGTAWTVFEGTSPEPMDVEILGVLHGYLGPGKDLILARLHGAKPEYTGVVAGMSGSPVYIQGKLAGALSYRIGQFSKEPIAGITPIEQMLEIRDLPVGSLPGEESKSSTNEGGAGGSGGLQFAAIDTPLTMSGFEPEAIRVWKERVAGTGLEMVSAGGMAGGGPLAAKSGNATSRDAKQDGTQDAPIVPGSAVSLQLARGDLEMAATCTVTYVDPKQLLACGHPVLQAGPISLPMTATDVLATLPSPMNAFKIVNTGRTIGAFTEDRAAGIRGVLGAEARMIPISMTVSDSAGSVKRHVEVVDLASMTASIALVSVYQTLLETNQSSVETSYHVTGTIRVAGQDPVPVDVWGVPGEQMVSQLAAAYAVGESFTRLYSNAGRVGKMESVELHIEAIPRDMRTELEGVRLISSSIVHAGDTVTVEATLRTWEQKERNVRIPFTLPARLEPGALRVLVGSAAGIDRTLDAAGQLTHAPGEAATVARLRGLHAGDQLYVSLLLPESQATLEGETLEGLPLSMANMLESQRTGLDVGLHGESLMVVAQAAAGGVLNGQQIVNLRVEAGGGLH